MLAHPFGCENLFLHCAGGEVDHREDVLIGKGTAHEIEAVDIEGEGGSAECLDVGGEVVGDDADGGDGASLHRLPRRSEIIETDHSLVCGAMEGMPYDEDEIWLEKGGTFFIYTDGVPEATNGDDELFGVERMLASLNQNPDAGPKELLAKVRKDVDDFVGDAPQFDDLTMMAIRLK